MKKKAVRPQGQEVRRKKVAKKRPDSDHARGQQTEGTPAKKQVDGRVWISRQYKAGRVIKEDSFEEDPIKARAYPSSVPLGSVSVTCGFTKNLGDFNSARIDVGITLPCVVEELEEAYQAAVEFAASKLAEQRTELSGEDD